MELFVFHVTTTCVFSRPFLNVSSPEEFSFRFQNLTGLGVTTNQKGLLLFCHREQLFTSTATPIATGYL